MGILNRMERGESAMRGIMALVILVVLTSVVAMAQGDATDPAQARRRPQPQALAEAVSRSVLQAVLRGFSDQSGVSVRAITEHPVVIAFSGPAPGTKPENYKWTRGQTIILEQVELEMEIHVLVDAVKRSPGQKGAIAVSNPTGYFKRGRIVAAGEFTVDGKRVVISGGQVTLASEMDPVGFSDGLVVSIDGEEFAHADSKWQQTSEKRRP